MTKVFVKRFCCLYGIFPGNDVITTARTALLKYRSLIGYRHGGGEIYKVELWEALWKRLVDFFCCVSDKYRVFNGRKAPVFTLIFHQWIPNKRRFAFIASDRCNDEGKPFRWPLYACTENQKLHETLLRLYFKALFRWKVHRISDHSTRISCVTVHVR